MFSTLRSKFIVAFILVESFFLFLIVGLNFSTLDRASAELIKEKIESSSDLFLDMIKVPMAVSDLATLDDAIKSFKHQKNIEAIRITDSSGNVVSEYLNEKRLSRSTFEKMLNEKPALEKGEKNFIFKKNEIVFESFALGTLYIAFETTETAETIEKNTYYTILLILLFILASYFVADFVGSRLGSSLHQLIGISEHVANDEIVEIPIHDKRDDEIGTLFKSMHQMQECIQDRKRTLNQTLNTLQQFVNALDESAIVSKTTPEGIITFANQKFCDVSGFSLDEVVGKTHRILRHPDNDKALFEELWSTILAKKIYHKTIRNRKKSGESYYVDATIVPLLDTSNEIIEFIAIRYDVTDLVLARNQAIEAEKSKDAFLSNMSHEIRTPLNAILGFVHLLQKEIREEKARSYLNIIEGSSATLLQIINDILDFSKIQSGKFEIEAHPFDPIREINLAVKLFSAITREKEISFVVLFDPQMPLCVKNDLIRIKQILFNFLSNAFKFTPQGGTVTVGMDFDYATNIFNLYVKDSGIGISKKQQQKIFNAFEQADSSTTRLFGGTGLGLSITVELVKLMGGEITLESELGEGSTFSIHIPMQICAPLHDEIKSVQRSITVGILPSEKNKPLLDAVIYYLDNLKVKYRVDDLLSNHNSYDVMLFASDGGAVDEKIKNIGKPVIAVMAHECASLRENEHIFTLAAPFCSVEILELLNEDLWKQREKNATLQTVKRRFGGSVLVAEDNTTNQLLIGLLLEEYGLGYTVANNGIEAVELYREGAYDLILMDENMPLKSGIEAFEMIRQYETEAGLQRIPVVALTANALLHDKERYIEAGMDDFLAKPINVDELERVLERFLQESAIRD